MAPKAHNGVQDCPGGQVAGSEGDAELLGLPCKLLPWIETKMEAHKKWLEQQQRRARCKEL